MSYGTHGLIWLIPLLPGLGAAVNGIFGIRLFSKRTAGLLACTTMAAAFGLSVLAFWQLLGLAGRGAGPRRGHCCDWIPAIRAGHAGRRDRRRRTCPWAFRLDPLSAMMILVVTGIGFLIHVYSTAYMHDEPRGGVRALLLPT